MRVSALIRSRQGTVHTIGKTALAAAAARLLNAKHIGVLIVQGEDGNLCGILSERDIVSALAVHGDKALKLTVEDLMTSAVKTCRPSDRLEHALATMARFRIRHLPVVEEGAVIGLLSVRDAISAQLAEQAEEVEGLLMRNRCGLPSRHEAGALVAGVSVARGSQRAAAQHFI